MKQKKTNQSKKTKQNELSIVTTLKTISMVCLLIYIAIIFYFALLPANDVPGSLFNINSLILHFIEYIGLMLITSITLICWSNSRIITKSLILGFIISILTEIVQIFVPTRCFSLIDVLVNILGCLSFWIMGMIIMFIVFFSFVSHLFFPTEDEYGY